MKMPNMIKLVLISVSVLLISCSKHQLSDEQYIDKANSYRQQHQIRAAIIELKNALQVNPKNVAARHMLGQIYVDLGDAESGEKELAKAAELGDNSEQVKLGLARARLMRGKNEEVIDSYSKEENGELLALVANAYMAQGNSKQANVYVAKAVKLDPESVAVKLASVELAFAEGRYETAGTALQEVLHLSPDNKLAWRDAGIVAMQQTRFADAEHAFQQVIDLEKADIMSALALQGWLGLIQAQLAQKEIDKATQNVQQLKAKSPAHPGVQYLAALLAFEKGDYETARTDLQRLNGKVPDYLPAVLLLGATHYALGSYEQAASYLNRYVHEVPSNLNARKLLASTRIKQQRSGEALDLLQDVEDSGLEDSQLIAMIAYASITSGNVTKGTEYLQKAKAANPGDPGIRAELAKVLLGQGAFDQAINELEAIADKYAKPRDILIIAAYLRKKDYAQARKLAKQLVQNNPGADTQTLFGGVELISGARAAARSHFEKALQLDKEYLPAMLHLGRMELEDGDFKQANTYFNTILSKKPDSLQALLGLAQVADQQGDEQQALVYVEKAREADKNALLPRLILGRYYLNKGEVETALAVVEELQQAHLQEPAVMLLAGKVYLRSGQTKKSLTIFQDLVKKLPNEPGVYFELASSQVRLNLIEDAKKSLQKALQLKQDFMQARLALAQLQLKSGNLSEALKLAKQMQQQDAKAATGFTLAGDIYMQQKDYAKARQQYEKARQREASSLLALKLSATYSSENNFDQAIGELNKWLKKNPDDTNIKMALAQEYQHAGSLDRSVEVMNDIVAQQPDNAVALNNLAWMYFSQNNPKAVEYAERAHELQPNVGAITDTLGWLLVQNDQQLTRAVALLREAVEKTANIPEIKYHLAVALYKTNNMKEAQTLLDEVVASNAQFSDSDKAKELLTRLKK